MNKLGLKILFLTVGFWICFSCNQGHLPIKSTQTNGFSKKQDMHLSYSNILLLDNYIYSSNKKNVSSRSDDYFRQDNISLQKIRTLLAICDILSLCNLKNYHLYLAEGYLNLRLSRWEEARKNFENALEMKKNADAYVFLGISFWMANKDKSNALHNIDEALQRGFPAENLSIYKFYLRELFQTVEYIDLIKRYQRLESEFRIFFDAALRLRSGDAKVEYLTKAINSWGSADNEKSLAEAYNERGIQFSIKNKSGEAIGDFNSAIVHGNKILAYYFNRGLEYAKMEQYMNAINDFSIVIKYNPYKEMPYIKRGRCYYCLHQYNAAIKDYGKAIRLKPNLSEPFRLREIVYIEKKDYKNAITDINKEINLNPRNYDAYCFRGYIYSLMKKYDRAIDDYNNSLRFNPDYPKAYVLRGNIFFNLKQYALALLDYTSAINLDKKSFETYLYRGNIYTKIKSYYLAVLDYNNAILLAPQSAGIYNNRGWAYLHMSKWVEAKADFDESIRLDENNFNAYDNLGIYYWVARKDKQKSIFYFEKAFKCGYTNFSCLYQEDSDGYFLKGFVQTPEFIELLNKYNPHRGKSDQH